MRAAGKPVVGACVVVTVTDWPFYFVMYACVKVFQVFMPLKYNKMNYFNIILVVASLIAANERSVIPSLSEGII